MARPLDRFPLIRAHHVEGAREALSGVYSNDMALEPLERGGTIDITINSCQLSQTGLNYTGYGAGVRVNFCGSKFVTLSFPIKGGAKAVINGTERLLGPQCGLITPADTGFEATLNADYEHVVLRMDSKILEDKLAALMGMPVEGPLQFGPLLEFSGVHAKLLRDNFFFLVDMVGRATESIPKLLQSEFEQAVTAMFLYASRHRYSHLLEEQAPEVTPVEVRRAEDYIEVNWREPIKLEDLAAVTGASVLSLVRSFKRYRGYTPMQFLEQVRNGKRGQH
jgi:hypothetical protein